MWSLHLDVHVTVPTELLPPNPPLITPSAGQETTHSLTMFRRVHSLLPRSATVRTFRTSAPALQIYDNVLETIGKTPVVRINKMVRPDVNLYVKCEYFNPLSSVKDRLALAIIEDAEKSGKLKPGQTVVEATSGNTGIALAMVCAQKGYPLIITMAESFSIERRRVMRMLGAKVVVTPAVDKGTGMVKKAKELAAEHDGFLCCQFENPANPAFHAQTTGPEILSDFSDRGLDYWVTGYGTGGTLQGVGKMLKTALPDVRIVASEPANAAILSSGIPQEREADGSSAATHPNWEPHPIQGWTPDFIPQITQDASDMELIDEIMPVAGPDAIAASQALAREEGIFTGISGGASMWVAMQVAATAPAGSNILAMLADTGERCKFSTPCLFSSLASISLTQHSGAIFAHSL